MTGACVLCGSGLTGPNRSWEHVIPESLGGKLRTHRVLCRSCNSRTGHDWDAMLAQQLLRVSVLVFPERHPLGHRTRRVRDDQGNSLILKGGIRGGAEYPQAIVHKVGETFDLTIRSDEEASRPGDRSLGEGRDSACRAKGGDSGECHS